MRFSPFRLAVPAVCALSLSLSTSAVRAQEPVDAAAVARIRDEGLKRSQLPATLAYLTDVIGPRLTGSPGLLRANEWTKGKLEEWGLVGARLEPWGEFGRGWTLERFSMEVIAPTAFPVIALPKAWSTGFSGTAEVVYLEATDDAGLEKYRGTLKGKIVMISPERDVAAHFAPEATRYTDEALSALASSGAGARVRGGQGGPNTAEMSPEQRERFQAMQRQRAMSARLLAFCKQERAAAVLDSARGDGGTLFVQQATVPSIDPPGPRGPEGVTGGQRGGNRRPSPWKQEAEKAMVPQVAVSVEHYNRILRMVRSGEAVRVDLRTKVRFNGTDSSPSFNTVAEIAGTDKADEVVMCGGHIDSWHGGTGATDDGAGVAVAMEAVRILKAIGAKPRRTIRVALWSGEEQGIFGSAGYVREHFGTREQPKPEHARFSGYFNLDNGTGRIRGVWCQGNSAVMPIFQAWLAPFADLGATTVTLRTTGGTDHLPFDGAGLPGFQFIQDTIEYDARTHHSNQDVFDRIQIEDMKQAATIMASFLLHTANRDDKLPRKTPVKFEP